MKRFAQTGNHKSFKVQSNATPQQLRLFDFIGKHRDKRATQSYHSKLNRTTQSIDMWKQRTLQLNAPSKIDVSLLATPFVERILSLLNTYETKKDGRMCIFEMFFKSASDGKEIICWLMLKMAMVLAILQQVSAGDRGAYIS